MNEHRVVATAGHVDHGKSSLIMRLTGIDPDRWDEEKRRGLTIDLGYAWCVLPSGREIGFVDVPGHERFIGNMLAGVGPVPLVLFVVAADEGWKPQSEEHLQILDVMGVRGGVVALTKVDLVDAGARSDAVEQVRARLSGTSLAAAAVVGVSSRTGEGFDEISAALDAMLDAAPSIEPQRSRLFVDRVFTIKGAGTVATGTLTGGCMSVGDEVALYPGHDRARIRSLQTHRKTEQRACAVSRVAANLAGTQRGDLARGNVLGAPEAWRPTDVFEAVLRRVRGIARPIGARGAYKVYAGAAEVDASLRFYGSSSQLEPGGEAFVRVRAVRPLLVDVFDRFVLREAGRRETVGGGVVLDVAPPRRAGDGASERLAARLDAARDELPGLLAIERGAVRAEEAATLTGSTASGAEQLDGWIVRPGLVAMIERAVAEQLTDHHRRHPLEEGADLRRGRAAVSAALRAAGAPTDSELVDALIADAERRGVIVTSSSTIRSADHRVALEEHGADIERLLAAIGGENEATPPTVKELLAARFDRAVLDAAGRQGTVVRVSPDIVVTPGMIALAETAVRDAPDGITVSAFREALGTSRKYAVPILEYLDRQGVTRRDGDLRFPR